jgi:hypothetical protein
MEGRNCEFKHNYKEGQFLIYTGKLSTQSFSARCVVTEVIVQIGKQAAMEIRPRLSCYNIPHYVARTTA